MFLQQQIRNERCENNNKLATNKKIKVFRWLKKKGLTNKRKGYYFPIQNLLKILSSKSSVVTSPVISPK